MPTADLLTIVFTDWVASTATRVRLGEERADELQHVHDRMLRDVVAEHGGSVVKGSGDGIVATFDSATDALAASVAIQQRVDEYSVAPGALAAIELRVGISVGDVVHQDGDIFGTPVVEAKRLEAAAEPGQILCSELVRMLARGRGGYEFDLVGLMELKGLPEPVAVCAVLWERSSAGIGAGVPLPPELAGSTSQPFVGRDAELDDATALARTAAQTHLLWILGEPGIGKTSLATEIAGRAHGEGALVLYGRCDEDVLAPFQPFVQALRWFAGQIDDERLAGCLGRDVESLSRLVPEIRHRLPGLLAATDAVTDNEQYRLFEAVASWLAAAAGGAAMVFVVDDVHWADRATLALLAHLVRGAGPSRLLFVCTARDTDPDSSGPLADLIADLDRTDRSRRVPLEGLTSADVVTLVAWADPGNRRPDRLAQDLAEKTAGNPLFVSALIAGLRAGADEVTPGDVRLAVRRRVRRLSTETQEMLQVAAIVGLEFALPLLVDAAGVDDRDCLARVEHAVAAKLVEEIAVDRFRFTHALVRDVLAEELTASRRARLHAAVAGAIESRFANALDDHLRPLAVHYSRAGEDRSSIERALDYAIRSARRSMTMLAFDGAVLDYELALDLWATLPGRDPAERIDLLTAKGEAERTAGTHLVALPTLAAAAELARGAGDWERYALAALAYEEATWRPGLLGHDAAAMLSAALDHREALRDDVLVRVQATYGRALHFAGQNEAARAAADEGLAAARRLGDPSVLAHALVVAMQVRQPRVVADLPDILAWADELWAVVTDEDADLRFVGCQYAWGPAIGMGDRELADTWIARGRQAAANAASRFARYVALSVDQGLAFAEGNLAEAERLAEEALAFAEEQNEDVAGVYGVELFMIRREQDRLREIVPAIRLLVGRNGGPSMWQPGLVLLLAEVGLREEAIERLTELATADFATIPRDDLLPAVACFLVEAAFLVDAVELVPPLRTLIAPFQGEVFDFGHAFGYLGSAWRYRGLLAELEGRVADAAAHYDRAIDVERRLRMPIYLARSLFDAARVAVRREDLGRAEQLVAEARAIADEHGLVAIRRRLGEVLTIDTR